MYPLYIKISGYKVGTEGTKREEKAKMRGFKATKQPNHPELGDAAYQHFIKVAKIRSDKTEEAKKRFKTPAYYFGDRRRMSKSENRTD